MKSAVKYQPFYLYTDIFPGITFIAEIDIMAPESAEVENSLTFPQDPWTTDDKVEVLVVLLIPFLDEADCLLADACGLLLKLLYSGSDVHGEASIFTFVKFLQQNF